MDVSAGEEQQYMLFSKAFDTHPRYPAIITGGTKAELMGDKVDCLENCLELLVLWSVG